VLPLISAAPVAATLVTSRATPAALATHWDVDLMRVDPLTREEAVTLLHRVIGPRATAGDQSTVATLADLCGRLPLALRIAGARVISNPAGTVRLLAEELSDERNRLAGLEIEHGARGVRAAFASAYRALPDDAARTFRLLGLFPGVTFGPHQAAALTAMPLAAARMALDHLVQAHLVTPTGPDRYALHDLVRIYARECAEGQERAEDQATASLRLTDWCTNIFAFINQAVHPHRRRVSVARTILDELRPFKPDLASALLYADIEWPNVIPLLRHLADTGRDREVWNLVYFASAYLDVRLRYQDRHRLYTMAVAATERLGDLEALALAYNGLAIDCTMIRRFADALAYLSRSLGLRERLGDLRGAGSVHNNIGLVYRYTDRLDEAVTAYRKAVDFSIRAGDHGGLGIALNNLGEALARQGELASGLRHLHRSLDIRREHGDSLGEAITLDSIGEAYRRHGDLDRALEFLHSARTIAVEHGLAETTTVISLANVHLDRTEPDRALELINRALQLTRAAEDRHTEAVALGQLARARLLMGHLNQARESAQQALAIRTLIPDQQEHNQLTALIAEIDRAIPRRPNPTDRPRQTSLTKNRPRLRERH
jgi:tetratricopeptide (TPR) repeat protein